MAEHDYDPTGKLPDLNGVHLRGPVSCDSCGRLVTELHRYRHRDCPPPPLPDIARTLLEAAPLMARRAARFNAEVPR